MPADQPASQTPLALDKFPDMVLPALYSAAVGPVNAAYYLKHFTRFDATQRTSLSWNWAASLCTFNWLIFRKLPLAALMYLLSAVLLPLLLLGLGRLVFEWSNTVEWGVLLALASAFFAVPGLIGNRLLYSGVRRAIERAITAAPTIEDACQTLRQHASTRKQLLRLGGVNAALGLLAALIFALQAQPKQRSDDMAPADVQRPFGAATAARSVTSLIAQAAVSEAQARPASSPDLTASASTPAAAPAPAPAPASTSTSAPTPRHASAPSPAPSPAATSAVPLAPTALVAAPRVSAHLVNVGLFANPDNARRAYIKLFKADLPASRAVIEVHGQKLTRVRSGPYASRAEARAAVARIKALKLDAVLVKP